MYKKTYLWLIIVLVTTFLFLSPNLKNELLNWDDPVYISTNQLIKDTSPGGVKDMFTTKEVVGTYSPLVLLSWSVDYSISELNPFTFHLFNIIYHLMVVALVFYLALFLSKRVEVAFITAMLFGIHPMHVEVAGWISARKDLIYSIFFFAGLIVYHFYTEHKGKRTKRVLYIACLLLFLLALLSKGTAVIFPLVLLLVDMLKKRQGVKHIVIEKVPFMLLSGVFLYIALQGQASEGAMDNAINTSVVNSISVGFYGYITYLIKAVFPFNLCGYHPYPKLAGGQLPWYFYVSATPVIALFIVTIIKARTKRFLGFGILFFFISLIPVIQVLPFGTAVMADRYTYLPYFGLFLLFAIWIIHVVDTFKNLEKPIWAVVVICFIFLGSRSFQYSKTFKNSETFWSHVIDTYPGDYLAYLNRGNYRTFKQQYKAAINDFNTGLQLNPDDYSLLYNRGVAYKNIGEPVKAIKDYSTSIKLHPESFSSYLNRGIVFSDLKNYDQAIRDFTKVLELNPEHYKAYYNRAIAFKQKGKYDLAVFDLSKLIALKQIEPLALVTRGEVFLLLNQKQQALNDFNTAIQLKPNVPDVYIKRGLLYLNNKRFDLAKNDFETALKLDRSLIEAHINLGVILMNNKVYNKAMHHFNTAQKLNPKNYIVYYNRGLLQLLLKNYIIAIEEFNTCLKIKPDFTAASKDRVYAIKLLRENNIN